MPPIVKQVIKMLAPRVDKDGNELGGVPVVLRDAPLGTYLGWNITAAGFHKDKICNYAGGMIPFARTKAERKASGDPRLSVEERYGSREGYNCAVMLAARKAVRQGFLLQAGADGLVAQAETETAANSLLPSDPRHRVARAICSRLDRDDGEGDDGDDGDREGGHGDDDD